MSEAQNDEVQTVAELIESELRDGEVDQALTLCEHVVSVDPRNAELQYLYGRCLFELGKFASAESAFRRAMDEDVCPLRATSAITATIRRVADQESVPLIDFEQGLRDLSLQENGHACFGSEYFLDHVHPTINVHRHIALWVIEGLQRANWLGGSPPDDTQIFDVTKRVESRIDLQTQGVAFRNLAKVLHWAGKFEEAAPRAIDAIRLLPADVESRFVLADCLQQTGRQEEAYRVYRELFERGDFPRAYLPYGEMLAERGELLEAKSFLMRALLSDREDYRTRAHYSLGLVHYQLGEFEFAIQSLRESDRLFPNDPATIALIAEAELGQGAWETAVREFERLTGVDPDNYYARFRLAEILSEHDRLAEAKQQIDLAVKLEPSNPEASALQKKIVEKISLGVR